MKDATLCFVLDAGSPQRVLLGYKKGGFGEGKFDGFGGKVEPGETTSVAAARELMEESGLVVSPGELEYVAHLDFLFPHRPEWSQIVHAFVAHGWAGTPTESDEMVPQWFEYQEIPYARMWGDSLYWLPLALAGKRLHGHIEFLADNETVGSVGLCPLDAASATALASGLSGSAGNYPADQDQLYKLRAVATGLSRRFPAGNDAFQIMTCLLEECGELAQQVNHFMGAGIKAEKMGEPSPTHLALEIKHVLLNALRVAQHFGVEPELRASVECSYQQLLAEGWIEGAASTHDVGGTNG
jgi:8-oxo-dGTP pyrophosphatase MutT (NUDIX family)/NTP pyrophosphatase (non-canonical NTP hydrolase)